MLIYPDLVYEKIKMILTTMQTLYSLNYSRVTYDQNVILTE